MRSLDACFFCTTPYQIIAAILIVKQLDLKADLYIINQFSYADQCCKNIMEENIFNTVRVVDEQRYKYKGNRGKLKPLIWCKSTLNYIQIDKIASQILIGDTLYNQMFLSSKNTVAELIFLYFQRHEIQTQTKIFDDGVGSYTKSEILSASFGNRLIQKIVFGKADLEEAEPDFLYSPELYYNINGYSGHEIHKISNLFQFPRTLELFNRIFEVPFADIINEKVILLDFLKNRDFDKDEQKNITEIYQKIFYGFETENVVVKKHPRDTEDEQHGVKYFKDYQIPFECICMNMNCNNKVLISALSTAVTMPKLLLNQEPYVIMLYKLIIPHSWSNEKISRIDNFYQIFKKLYSRPERVIIPNNKEELISYLATIKRSAIFN